MNFLYLRLVFVSFLLIYSAYVKGQQVDFLDNEQSNFYSNPASFHFSDNARYEINLLSTGLAINSNTAKINLFNVGNGIPNFFRSNILHSDINSSGVSEAYVSLPSFSIRKNDDYLSFRFSLRSITNFKNLDGRLFSDIGESIKEVNTYPYVLQGNDASYFKSTFFGELSSLYNKTLINNQLSKINFGIRGKVFFPNTYSALLTNNLDGSVMLNRDGIPYLTLASGHISTYSSGNFFNNFFANFSANKISFGIDIGVQYIFKPQLNNLYKAKLGFSVSDIGQIIYNLEPKFSKSYDISIGKNQGLYFNNNFNNSEFNKLSKVFDNYPNFFQENKLDNLTLKENLPSIAKLNLDYNITKSISFYGDLNVSLNNRFNFNNLYKYDYLTLEPRWHNSNFALAFSSQYIRSIGAICGLKFKYRNFSFGSTSLISSLFQSKQLDGYFNYSLYLPKTKNKNSNLLMYASLNRPQQNILQENVEKDSTKLITSSIEALGYVIPSDNLPFWLRANQYGSIPSKGSSVSLIADISKGYKYKELINKFDWAADIELRSNFGSNSTFSIIQAYSKFKFSFLQLKVGRSRDITGLVDSTYSMGSFSVSGNALGIPKIELSIPNFFRLPIFDGLFSIKGNFSHGWLGSIPLIPYTDKEDHKYARNLDINQTNTFYHQKALYGRFGKPDWKFQFFAGFNHNVFWGNESLIYKNWNLSSFNTFIKVITGSVHLGSKVGNHVGSIDFGSTYSFKNLDLFVYRQNFYDVGALYYLANIKDGLNGIQLKNKKITTNSFKWNSFLFELLYSKSQAGEQNAKITPSGDEDYYNNYLYQTGWSYKGQILGTPFFTSREFSRDNLINDPNWFIINNRVLAFNFASDFSIGTFNFFNKISYSRNFGTYHTSSIGSSRGEKRYPPQYGIFVPVNQLSFIIGSNRTFKNGTTLGVNIVGDYGNLLPNILGLNFSIKKQIVSL